MSRNSQPQTEKAAREARLAQALRTNLRRRKAAPAAADQGTAKPDSPGSADQTSSD